MYGCSYYPTRPKTPKNPPTTELIFFKRKLTLIEGSISFSSLLLRKVKMGAGGGQEVEKQIRKFHFKDHLKP